MPHLMKSKKYKQYTDFVNNKENHKLYISLSALVILT